MSLFGMMRRSRKLSAVVILSLGVGAGCVTLDQHFSQKAHEDGNRLYAAGDYDNAAGAYRNAIKAEPRDYQAYYFLGCCYTAQKDYEKAEHAFRTSLDVMSLTFAGQHDADFRRKVVDGLARAIAIGPNRQAQLDAAEKQAGTKHDAESYLLVAKIYRYSGDADSAIENYNKAALIAPDDKYIIRELGLYFEQLGQARRAEPALRRAYNLGADDAEVTAAMRRLNIIPGPAIKPQADLAKPVVPEGLPDVTAGGR